MTRLLSVLKSILRPAEVNLRQLSAFIIEILSYSLLVMPTTEAKKDKEMNENRRNQSKTSITKDWESTFGHDLSYYQESFIMSRIAAQGRRNAIVEDEAKSALQRVRRKLSTNVYSSLDDWDDEEIDKILSTKSKGRRHSVFVSFVSTIC